MAVTAASATQEAATSPPDFNYVTLHDREIAYRELPGSGPTLLLIHGVGGSATDWDRAIPLLAAADAHVISVDLPGHGRSDKRRGDYSLGAMASTLRDLLDHLAVDQVTLVGHSLGGGISLQFIYQFPQRAQGLILVSSGGLGEETPTWLRAATLPGANYALAAVGSRQTTATLAWLTKQMHRLHITEEFFTDESLARLAEFSDPLLRDAFLATLRSVVDINGQRVSALGKLPALGPMPVLLIWGAMDPLMPVSHGHNAVEQLENARLVIFPRVGHEPHIADPQRFSQLVLDYRTELVANAQ